LGALHGGGVDAQDRRADRERLLLRSEGGSRRELISRGIGAATWSVVDAMPNIVSKPAQLPEELGMYVDGLRRTYPAIDEVWVLGPRDDEERHRRWDLLAFADEDALAAIRANRSVHRADL